MASDDTTTVLDEANATVVRLMIGKLGEHDGTKVNDAVGGVGPIGDLAAEAMNDRNIDF